jgi:histone deacetylase 6
MDLAFQTCNKVFCSRFVHGHMVDHNASSQHPLALSMADLSVWCYGCDFYVDNQALLPFKSLLHLNKFGEPLILPTLVLESKDD